MKTVMLVFGTRPEAVDAGTVKLVGTDHDKAAYDAMSHAVNPYGDGHACPRIADSLK